MLREISHPALRGLVRKRIGDSRVLHLVRAFLKAGILGEVRLLRERTTGTPLGDLVNAAVQRGAVGPGRAHRPEPRRSTIDNGGARRAPPSRSAELPPGAVCRRLVPDDQGHAGGR